MTGFCKLEAKGISVEDSFDRLTKAVEKASSSESLSKYSSILKPKFYDYIGNNATKGDVPIDVEDIFSFEILDDQIVITNSDPYFTSLYEYGFDDDETGDIIPPRYFIRPAMERISADLKDLMIDEVNNQYKEISPKYTSQSWQY